MRQITMFEITNPFASVGTSNVFFQLTLGHTTPKQIVDSLKIKPPSVVEHLHKLQKIGVIEIGKKEGKYQHYEIKWKNFTNVFMKHIYTLQLQETALQSTKEKKLHKELEKENKLLKKVINELIRNVHFKELIKRYFEMLAKDMDSGLYPRRTIWGAIYGFEDAVKSFSLKPGSFKDPEVLKLLSLLEKWGKCARRFSGYGPEPAFERSLGILEKSAEEP